MDFSIWRRRWLLTISLIILTLVATVAAQAELRTYQSSSQVILLASRSAAKLNGSNPYLSFSPSLTLTADALSRELMAPGTIQDLAAGGSLDPYTVALAPYTTNTTGSVLLITVTGGGKAGVESKLHAVTQEISVGLQQLQHGVSASAQVRAAILSYTPQATLNVSTLARSVAPVTVLGLLLALGIPVIVDGRLATRRVQRHGAVLPGERLEPGQPTGI
jgi:hypothetical protein